MLRKRSDFIGKRKEQYNQTSIYTDSLQSLQRGVSIKDALQRKRTSFKQKH